VARCLISGGKILTCGNGGSASDAEHITAELVGRLRRERRSLPSIALTCPGSLITALGNDYGYEHVFSRQVEGNGRRGDVLLCLSTSGNSLNVLNAARVARRLGIHTIALTGAEGAKLAAEVDMSIQVPSNVTAHIQESHITLAHIICEIADELLLEADSEAAARPVASAKIRTLAELAVMRNAWRKQEQTVIWTNGVFDLLHEGHIRNLQSARALGSVLIVAVNSDRTVRTLKGPERPIQTERSRAEMLAALECVTYVAILDDHDPTAALDTIQPDVHCKGADYKNDGKPMPERETVERHGGRIHLLELIPGISTTGLIERIRSEPYVAN
jgi:D-sedoheptulose 7-phosphate isomerase